MTEWSVSIPQHSISELEDSLQQGGIIEIRDGRGFRFLTEETVAQINGLKVEIFSNEHPPPHFRVKYQSSTANFAISDCSMINGGGEIMKFEKNIILWWKNNKSLLIDNWNRLRPTDCPVGAYVEPTRGNM